MLAKLGSITTVFEGIVRMNQTTMNIVPRQRTHGGVTTYTAPIETTQLSFIHLYNIEKKETTVGDDKSILRTKQQQQMMIKR